LLKSREFFIADPKQQAAYNKGENIVSQVRTSYSKFQRKFRWGNRDILGPSYPKLLTSTFLA